MIGVVRATTALTKLAEIASVSLLQSVHLFSTMQMSDLSRHAKIYSYLY